MRTPGIPVVRMSTLPWWATTVPADGEAPGAGAVPVVEPALGYVGLACEGLEVPPLPIEPEELAGPPELGEAVGPLGTGAEPLPYAPAWAASEPGAGDKDCKTDLIGILWPPLSSA